MNITDNLRCTDAQRHAILHDRGPAMVIAGPGSGKTFVITHRISHLINDLGVSPDKILVITFTKAAAKEMQQRAALLLQGKSQPHFGTFHSVFYNIMRQSGMGGLSILSEKDRRRIFLHLMEKFEIQTPDPVEFIQRLSGDISCFKVRHALDKEFMPGAVDAEIFPEIIRTYECELKLMGKMDFDDMIIKTHRLLVRRSDLKKRWSARFEYIMIDEFQDIDPLQFACIKLLLGNEKNLFAVGDDDQSIYSFRGANFKNILDFPKIFPNTKIIKLEQNYRSSQNILNLANKVLEKAKEKYTKHLFSEIVSPVMPALVCAGNGQTEAQFIAQRILELHEDEDIDLKDIAVLMRSARMSFSLEIELAKRNIPYRKFGGLKFIETAHVKDVIAHLRVLLNPDDAVSYNRILLLIDGIGQQSANRLIPILNSNSGELTKYTQKNEKLKKLFTTLSENQNPSIKPVEAVKNIIEYYIPIMTEKFDDFSKRQKDLEHFEYLSEKYDRLEDFLSDLALEPPDSSVSDVEGEQKDDYLTLSTIHSAKGLEYRAVFIIGAVDGRFPSVYSFSHDEELEEELRLMYVAITRAKTHLTITYPIDMFDYSSGMVLSKPSRFLDDIPSSVLERWEIEE